MIGMHSSLFNTIPCVKVVFFQNAEILCKYELGASLLEQIVIGTFIFVQDYVDFKGFEVLPCFESVKPPYCLVVNDIQLEVSHSMSELQLWLDDRLESDQL